jgi:hypothetical protein
MTNYISKVKANNTTYTVGGDNFDGQWVENGHQILSNVTLAGGKFFTYSLANYLPDDEYVYEVIFEGTTRSVATSGKVAQLTLIPGTVTTAEQGWRLDKLTARTAAAVFSGGTAIIPIYPDDRNITVWTQESNSNNTNTHFNATAYRRVGKND